jgi:hypothetical protein
VAHLSSLDMLSHGAIAEMEKNLDEIEQELRTQAAGQLRASGAAWEFERRQGIVVDELIAAATAIGEAHPDETLAIIVGSSSPGNHRVVGSVAVGLARLRLIGGGRLGGLAYTGRFGPTVLPVLCKLHEGPVSSTPSRTPSPRAPADRHRAR